MEPTPRVPSKPDPSSHPEPPPTVLLEPRDDVERLGLRIAELAARISAATHQLLVLIREFDERDGWAATGFRSCAQWLSWRTGLAPGAAREKVRVARALADLPRISAAMATAELSYSKARALTRVATPQTEQHLLDLALHATASQVERFVRAWRRVDRGVEAERDRDAERRASRYLQMYTDDSGMVVVRGRLEPEVGALLRKALDAAAEELYRRDSSADGPGEEFVTLDQRRADGAGLLAESALSSGLAESGTVDTRTDRYQVVVHVDQAVLADPASPGASEVEGVGNVPAGTSRRLACDGSKLTMTHDSDGAILDVGRKSRVIPAALRRALGHRDKTCRFPGCDVAHCDAHHIHHWAAGGETRLDNLVLLCRRHHRAVHEEGFRVKPGADGALVFQRPDGRAISDPPPIPKVEGDPGARLVEGLIEAGVDVERLDHYPRWDGSPLDLRLAIEHLWTPSWAAD